VVCSRTPCSLDALANSRLRWPTLNQYSATDEQLPSQYWSSCTTSSRHCSHISNTSSHHAYLILAFSVVADLEMHQCRPVAELCAVASHLLTTRLLVASRCCSAVLVQLLQPCMQGSGVIACFSARVLLLAQYLFCTVLVAAFRHSVIFNICRGRRQVVWRWWRNVSAVERESAIHPRK
jgi:hypothetical protein